jgi:hypothetical protein
MISTVWMKTTALQRKVRKGLGLREVKNEGKGEDEEENKRVWDVTTEVAKYVENEGGGGERIYMEDNIEKLVNR